LQTTIVFAEYFSISISLSPQEGFCLRQTFANCKQFASWQVLLAV
jgi:hypothetical protein